MKNNCQHIQLALLEGSSDYAVHLEACSECREFVTLLEVSAGPALGEFEPDATLDQAVLAYSRGRRKGAGKSPMRFVAVLLAAAAAVMIGALVVMNGASVDGGGELAPIASGGEGVVPSVSLTEDIVLDETLSGLLQEVADADYSGEHIDDDILNMELQLAMLQTESF